MPKPLKKLRVALAAWEIGRPESGLGVKIGGLGEVVEQLPPELVKAAARQGLELEIETLSPCFAHYDRRKLKRLDLDLPAAIEGRALKFEAYERVFVERLLFPDGARRSVPFRMVYFWDEWQLNWTHARAVYPDDPWMAAKLYAAVCQAMAGYIRQGDFQTVHLHDYHVGLTPFYLGDEFLRRTPVHFTIHNASYQGITPLTGGGYGSLDKLNLPGERLFHKYFDFFDNLNLMKACILKTRESGGRITTVSGDLDASWGYAAELLLGHPEVHRRAWALKGAPPGEVFVPNRHLDVLEKLPAAGITNGLREDCWPQNLPALKCSVLRRWQARRGPQAPLFANPTVQSEMLARDHTFDVERLERKGELRRLLCLECFGRQPAGHPVLLTAVGRMAAQKNFDLIAEIIPRTLAYDTQAKFVLLAAPPGGDGAAQATQGRFHLLAQTYPGQVYFNPVFSPALSRLILAGGDFVLMPSRYEPCGLVDYEASLLGTLVIGHLTGGLAKVRHCAYLYEWLDISDRAGEAQAFFRAIQAALSTYRHDSRRHEALMRQAMGLDAGWAGSAAQYVELYRYGLLASRYLAARRRLLDGQLKSLGRDRELFKRYFAPGLAEYGDPLDWELKRRL
jgi:glycogen synthase